MVFVWECKVVVVGVLGRRFSSCFRGSMLYVGCSLLFCFTVFRTILEGSKVRI